MKRHLKRIAAPKTWPLERKEAVYITRPYPGGSSLDFTLPMSMVLQTLVKCAKTKKEVKYILHNKQVILDGKRQQEDKFPVSLLSVLELPEVKEAYRIILTKKGVLTAILAPAAEAKLKLCKIVGKTRLRGGKTQLNMSDGRNILVVKDSYQTGGSVLIDLPGQAIKQYFPLQEGSVVLLVGGKHSGSVCPAKKIQGDNLTISVNNEEHVTATRYAFVVGDTKPALTLQDHEHHAHHSD